MKCEVRYMSLFGNKTKLSLCIFYFAYFGAFGSFYPMISIWLLGQKLSVLQIGEIISISLLVHIIVQPIWGIICDKFQLTKVILIGSLILTSLCSIFLSFNQTFTYLLIMFTLLTIFNVAISPIIDSVSLESIQDPREYGFLRAWGALGYALFCWISSVLTNYWGIDMILYVYSLLMLCCLIVSIPLPIIHKSTGVKTNFLQDLRKIASQPGFLLFAIAGVLIFGSHQANNTYYSMFFKEIGGGVMGVGFSFLLVAGFEAPAMFLSNFLTKKLGLSLLIILAGILVSLRWLYYGLNPDYNIVMALLALNGLAIGLFVVLCTQFVNKVTTKEVQVTAHSLFWAFANGLGTMSFTYLGGVTLDKTKNVFDVYFYFGVLSSIGVLLVILAAFFSRKQKIPHHGTATHEVKAVKQ
ncbi:MFS transporter [Bacillus cereus]|uniref:MFS transporter n=1 Tax=Bacillus cereus TaxID=1396 RepID=UPI0013D74745|nr:MFS transporter [Bacillus cereus]